MYCSFYGLKEKPFNVTADPSFFFLSPKHKEAMSHLYYGITERKGIIAITGEIGTGKTTACRFFLENFQEKLKTAFILNPYFPEAQLFEAILKDFGIKPKGRSKFSFIWQLNHFLLQENEKGNNVVLIIDEAQNLSAEQLEQVRLLSNLETKKHKLIQIVLVGQPELNQKLDLHALRQLQQRISVRYHITPLEKGEIGDYINHRLRISGAVNRLRFSDDALEAIANLTQGTPRLINIVCDRALLAGYVVEKWTIDALLVNRCVDELSGYFLKKEGK